MPPREELVNKIATTLWGTKISADAHVQAERLVAYGELVKDKCAETVEAMLRDPTMRTLEVIEAARCIHNMPIPLPELRP